MPFWRRRDAHEFYTDAKSALERIKQRAHEAGSALSNIHSRSQLVDVSVQFIGASGLPKMDVVGSADPYFIATIDDKIKFTSTVQPDTLSPVWNELWHVKNVPANGKLKVSVFDKDDGSPVDDFIGTCELDLTDGTMEAKIESLRLKRNKGTFWAKITLQTASSPSLLPYTFDGPISYSQHFSPTVGLLTNLDDNGRRLYSTWKMRIRGVASFLSGPPQHWNTAYAAAQRIFSPGPGSLAVRSSIQAGHRLLYARSTRNAFGTIENAKDVLRLLTGGRTAADRIKPAVYTYVISVDDDTLRFSETGAAFFVDFASKHALHANCSETVWYSGEFHPRPEGGWEEFDELAVGDADVRWEIVLDNNSGTYAPDKKLLPRLKKLIEHNFPGIGVVALDREDPELEKSREACRDYALRKRGEARGELQPNKQQSDEETLSHRASIGVPVKRRPSRLEHDEDAFGGPAAT